MANARLNIVLLIGGSLLISGCQVFQGKTARLEAGIRIPQQADPRDYASQQFALGRSGIETRNYASAITAFRNSALEPEFAAASFNGIAIAYAGIGRNDLAERYFREAVAADPGSERYRNNLATLERSRFEAEYARVELIRSQPVAVEPPQARVIPAARGRAALTIANPRGRLLPVKGGVIEVGQRRQVSASKTEQGHGPNPNGKGLSAPLVMARQSLPDRTVSTRAETRPAAPTGPKQELTEKKIAVVPARPATVRAPKAASPDRPPQISTTGRRYSPQQFADIFAPYAQPEAREPIMASVTSPGLRSNAVPEPTFGKAKPSVAVESLALASQ